MTNFKNKLPHFIIQGTAKPENYTSPNQFPKLNTFPTRNRLQHASHLLSQITSIYNQKKQAQSLMPKAAPTSDGIYLEFESTPSFDLSVNSLDLPSKDIELLSVKKITENEGEKIVATIFVPDERIQVFIKKIEAYRDETTSKGNPKNNSLISSINNIKLALLKSLWTDLDDLFPENQESIWWELWLRATPEAVTLFQEFAKSKSINISSRIQHFSDRQIMLAYTTAEILSESIYSLGIIAEARRAKETTADFLQMRNHEQQQWVESLLGLIDFSHKVHSSVCILDTGVAKQHPLINPFLSQDDVHTCDPTWGAHDHNGHGTNMAGLALYGNLNDALLSTEKIKIPSSIESVKILPPNAKNHPDLYGKITEEAVSRVTINNPDKNRIICMAVTSTDDRDRGLPSSWSAAIDSICAGQTIPEKKHLFIISSGNANPNNHIKHPTSNLTDGIHDPGQSWNALTVGAYTEKVNITEFEFSGWTPLAEAGDIAPANTTSLTWERGKWPIKPDIVFEGGNAALDPTRETIDYPESLALLSTSQTLNNNMFTYIADTSAATAQVVHMAAVICEEYPQFWPETIRGLIVHSSEWTEKMQTYPNSKKQDRELLLRACGYGVPNLARALWSASNSLTLIAQDELKPYAGNSMNELNLHTLPWPTEVLRSLGETAVKMRVTLSYFIEPNPARRGWQHKFRYQSHGLRFDVKTPEETDQEFITRINKERWDEESSRSSVTSKGDASEWFFGERLRSKGSIHSDIWEGTAISLAERNQIAIYPVTGWWREMHSKGHTNKKARYSLIVTLSTPELTADIYTPIETLILNKIQIPSV